MQPTFLRRLVPLGYVVLAMVAACLQMVPWFIRLPLTLPLIVLVPGHLLLRALDTTPERDLVDHVMFAIGTSLALAVLVGLALNWSPWGLALPSQALALGGIALVSGVVAWRRDPAPLALPTLPPWWRVALSLALVAALCGGALAVARAGAAAQPQPGFTQAWLAPVAQAHHMVQLGLTNHEGSSHRYRLVLSDRHHTTTTWSNLPLADKETWQVIFSVAPGAELTVEVYLDNQTALPYRHVSYTDNE